MIAGLVFAGIIIVVGGVGIWGVIVERRKK